MLGLFTVNAYGCLREMRRNLKYQQYHQTIDRLVKYYKANIALRELSAETNIMEKKLSFLSKAGIVDLSDSLLVLMERHEVFFRKKQNSGTQL